MDTQRTLSALLLATSFASAAHAAAPARDTAPAITRATAQGRQIDAALHQGRLTATQATQLQAARASLESEARSLAGRSQPDVLAQLALSHRQDRLDWAIRSGDTAFLDATLAKPR